MDLTTKIVLTYSVLSVIISFCYSYYDVYLSDDKKYNVWVGLIVCFLQGLLFSPIALSAAFFWSIIWSVYTVSMMKK